MVGSISKVRYKLFYAFFSKSRLNLNHDLGKLPMVASSSRWRSLIVLAGEQVTVNRNRKEVTCYEYGQQKDHIGDTVDCEGGEHLN